MKYYEEGKRPKAYIKSMSMYLEELDERIQEEGEIGLLIDEYLGEIIAENQYDFLIKLDHYNNGWTIEDMDTDIYDSLSTDEIRRCRYVSQSFWWVEKNAIRTSSQICLMETE